MERNQLISLVTKAQNGNAEAMNELFSAFYNDIYYFALKTVKDSDIACDITQEACLEIINTIGSLKEPAAFVTWTKQITYHQCTRYFKKKKDVLVEEDEDGNTIFDTLADEGEDSIPSEIYEKEEFRQTILAIINELTEEQRSAVMMYYYDELSIAQIAKIQGVAEGTVKSRLNYARKAIKKSVEDYESKHGIKLHSLSLIPILMLFFGKEIMPAAKATEVLTVVSGAASAMAPAAGAAIGGTAVAAGATGGAGLAAKIASIPLVAKIVSVVIAASIAVVGSVALLTNEPADEYSHTPDDCVDANMDCVCDVCPMSFHIVNGERYLDRYNHDAVCEKCGIDFGFIDENMDNVCDVCGEFLCAGIHLFVHLDADTDGICDVCGNPTGEVEITTNTEDKKNQEAYFELDGICDKCGAEWDFATCFCEFCLWQKHTHGEGADCGICTKCGISLLIIDLNGGGKCDLCGEGQCGNIHPHWNDFGNNMCSICGAWLGEPLPTLDAPTISIVVNGDSATVSISAVDGATGYAIRINGNHMGDGRYDTTGGSITVTSDMLAAGENTITAWAYTDTLMSPDSNTLTVGKLDAPIIHATGTGVEIIVGDVENAEGYMIYDEDGKYIATIGLSGSYDLSGYYNSADGLYLPMICAYADGWISSEKINFPVFFGDNAPIGPNE